MCKKLYIWGWWQGKNLGDNWIKGTLSRIFPSAIFIDTTVQKFPKNSFVICGGGGLFIYDVIAPWDNIQKNISYGFLGLGAEFPHKTNKTTELFERAKFFLVRDPYSLNCMHLEQIERSYDITFAFPLTWASEDKLDRRKIFFVWRDGRELLKNAEFNKYIVSGSSYDNWINIIRSHFETIIEDDFQCQEDNIEERISNAGFIISGRYHGIVAAIQKGIPFIAIDICPKIRALLKDCDLEDYCVKISEIDKVPDLIKKAQTESHIIRKKEKEFTNNANRVLKKQLENVKLEILKVLSPLHIIHYGSYWMQKNDVVNTMSDDLSEICKIKKIDLKAYSSHPDRRIKTNQSTPNGKLCILDHNRIMKDVKKVNADALILNSGGLCLSDKTYAALKSQNVVTVGISLSDPDVFPYNGKIYADKFDIFYTNSKYSLENEYASLNSNTELLPFAASIKHHFYMPKVKRLYDIVIVAHAREDRIHIVDKLSTICHVGTYGNGWQHSLGAVHGKAHVKAINTGRMYLSFARTVAGFDNVKVGLFEAMACNQVVITSYMEELQDYFDINKEIICYRSEEELYDLVRYYMHHEEELEFIRKQGYARFLKDHTYTQRWNKVLKKIYHIKNVM